MYRRERHPRYMGSFLDFWVEIPEFAGDVKLRVVCVAPLTHVVLLLSFCHFLVGFDLFGGCGMQWGPPDVLIPAPSGVSILRTPRSIFSTLVPLLVTKFIFLELIPTGPVSRFI